MSTTHLPPRLDADTPGLALEKRNSTVAVYDDLAKAEAAVRILEHAGFSMPHLSIVAKGMNTERHVIGFDTHVALEGRWARWGGLWGLLFGAFIFIPGLGHVAIGGYLLYLITSGAIGAGTGALGAALSTVGVPDDAVIRYETALKADRQLLIAHGTPAEIEYARKLLSDTSAESVESHLGAPQPVS